MRKLGRMSPSFIHIEKDELMKLSNAIGLKEKDILSIVGAGGKTSLMFQIAQDTREDNKVLVTTTTKIYLPHKDGVDFIGIGENEFFKYVKTKKKGIHVYGMEVDADNKMVGINEGHLDAVGTHFDYVLIEADGAKEKEIKGWRENEPVIYRGTTKTIGILSIQALGKHIWENNVHRSKEFCKISNGQEGEIITLEHLFNMIVHPQGLFKNAKGEKILFINKSDDMYYLDRAAALRNKVYSCGSKTLNRIIVGSIANNLYDV